MLQADTIAAIATAAGAAGLAVVRVSGRDALSIADAIFHGAGRLVDAPSHTLHHGWAMWPNDGAAADRRGPVSAAPPSGSRAAVRGNLRLDEVVAAVFRAPRSYTREDVVEISCHGGERPAPRVLEALLAAGARMARPGEFTLRAFLSGRMDLTQAEAVADLIHAASDRAHELALSQLAGTVSRRLHTLSERIADSLAEVEARVDFAEDIGGIEVPSQVVNAIEGVYGELADLLAGSAYARAVREGILISLVGRPNVGKSSLFNALLGEERAIVTAIPGTTRDRVSEAIEVEGVRVTLSDTAGLRETAEPIEAVGIAIAEEAIERSGIVLWVVDGSIPLAAEDGAIAVRLAGRPVLIALNKSDRPARVRPDQVTALLEAGTHRVVAVSATRGDGLGLLRGELAIMLGAGGDERAAGAAIGNLRHVEALSRAGGALERAALAAREAWPGEIVALELREGLHAIGEVTGKTISGDLLDRIFSRFCIGK